jgi:hypothetical protein
LLGDVFNILGAVLQGVLPTMIILAIYYTIADVVLLAQCFYYRGFTLSDDVPAPPPPPPSKSKRASISSGARNGGPSDERTALLSTDACSDLPRYHSLGDRERRGSWVSHLSPAVPFVNEEIDVAAPPPPPTTWLQAVAFNSLAILMVCTAGVAGWYLSRTHGQGSGGGGGNGTPEQPAPQAPLEMSTLGQVFGWLCAALYLGSRLPQLLLNWRRKSTEGVSVLFFLFACLGNLTYVLSILAYEPHCEGADGCAPGEAARVYWQYMLVNMSWLAGSAGTLLLDLGIFVQFFMYSKGEELCSSSSSCSEIDSDEEGDPWDQMPVLERNNTGY